jgi:hypothetical protein
MKQTVVGVFETSEEARRAQAALLDARFSHTSVRVSGSGALRGVDEGMAYPVSGPQALDAGQSEASLRDREGRALHPGHEGPLERVADFLKGLFSPESQREELARYEEAVRRGGALVAVDVEDEVEQSLASDILIRAGAYDLEERVSQWGQSVGAPQDVSLDPESARMQSMPARPPVMPGNVTSMDPSDPTGYRASRTDFQTGETWPAARTAFETAGQPMESAPRQAPPTQEPAAVHHENLAQVPLGAGMAPWDPHRGDFGVEGDFGTERMSQQMPGMRQEMSSNRDRETMRNDLHREGEAWRASTSGTYGEERVQPMSAEVPDTPIIRSRDLDRPSGAPFDQSGSVSASQSASQSGTQSSRAKPYPHMAAHDADLDSMSPDPSDEVVSSREARHLLASGAEVFLDDSGFARTRDGGRVQPRSLHDEGRGEPTKIARNVRVYSRRADDPAIWQEAQTRDDSTPRVSLDERDDRCAGAFSRDAESLAALGRGIPESRGSSRWQDAGEVDPLMSHSDELSARDAAVRDGMLSPEGTAFDAQQELAMRDQAMREQAWQDVSMRDGSIAGRKVGTEDSATPMRSRPGGADALARHEAALREQTLRDFERMESSASSPAWSDSERGEPLEHAAEMSQREASVRDETLQDYAAMDERAEMRAANAAAAAHARGGDVDDDPRYSMQSDPAMMDDGDFVDTGSNDRRSHRASEWGHMKQAVRNAWHRMTHPGRHH